MSGAILIGAAFAAAAVLVFLGATLLRAGFIHLIGGRQAARAALSEV